MTIIERSGYRAIRTLLGRTTADRISYQYRDRVQPFVEAATYGLTPRGRRSRQRLELMKDAFAGKRCFIIGNGPSLLQTDLSKLRGECTFGLNRGYLLFDRIGEPTTFLVAVNRYVVEQFGDELLRAPSTLFVSWRSRRLIRPSADPIYLRRSRPFTFSDDIAQHGAWEGATVTYVAMQLAFHLGFTEVVLIGVDHSFADKGPANKLITSSGTDSNHFDPDYFGAGVKWQLPDLEVSEAAYRLALDAFSRAGRSIVDATVGGALDVFPKVSFDDLVR